MELKDRITAFASLGDVLKNLSETELAAWSAQAFYQNQWFDETSVRTAIKGIGKFLEKDALTRWVADYNLENVKPVKVGVVMAGNIPLAGFHDFLSVLISGHYLLVKKSSQDSILLDKIADELKEIAPDLYSRITFSERLNDADAVIATGSDNTSRYFEYYFASKPHIIRKNRTSVAVIRGDESEQEITELGKDVFTYFGLGCRNVSKVFLPEGFNPAKILDAFQPFHKVVDFHKYANNYDYNRSIYLLKSIPFLDSGYLCFKEDELLVSSIAVLYYQFYKDQNDLNALLKKDEEKLQCIVSAGGWFDGSVPFGNAQFPELTDYADKVDTLRFLEGLG
jgi:hypothetical protein